MGLNFKLGIGIPLIDEKVHTQFFTSFVTMHKPNFTLLMPKQFTQFSKDIAEARDNIVKQAIDDGCTHLIMMDTDQIYPEDTIQKLLAHGKDVVGAMVHRRWIPFDPILYRGAPGAYTHVSDEETYAGNLVEVDATGCGCILYDTSVFFGIKEPWFEMYHLPDGRLVGEDINFCNKLKEAGKKIYVDTSIKVDHMTNFRVNESTYKLLKKIHNFDWK